jgi:hypothetical protein
LKKVDAFEEINPEAKIFVPEELYDEWIAATNWTSLADHIVPVKVIPEIVTPDYVSEGLEYSDYPFAGYGLMITGRGSCTDSVIVVPEEYNGEPIISFSGIAFENDSTIDTLILPESGMGFFGSAFKGSSLKRIKNSSGGLSGFMGAENLELVSFIDIDEIDHLSIGNARDGVIFDFTRNTKVCTLKSVYDNTFGPNTKICVPIELYDEWITATNWATVADRIVCGIRKE